ncbi:MAG: hypothetical protein VW405_08325 [Rhodospirillaceae bacterium]
MPAHRGGCHCGNLTLVFETAVPPAEMPVRACQCSFCRKHGVRAIADAGGSVAITAREPDALVRYRFGHGETDFLVCGRCGVYVAAYMEDGADGGVATVVANALDDQAAFVRPAEPVSYDGEAADGRRARRRKNWTPARLVTG